MEQTTKSSIKLLNFIVHKVFWRDTEEGGKIAECDLRESEHDTNGLSENFIHLLTDLFSNTSLTAGCFWSDKTNSQSETKPSSRFQETLQNSYIEETFDDFVQFSRYLTQCFTSEHWGKTKNGKPGYLFFYHYEHNKTKFLAVVMLHETTYFRLNKSISLEEDQSLDLRTLHQAARINLTNWADPTRTNPKYLRFKSGKNTIRDFFSEFIGCDEFIEQRKDTEYLRNAIEFYCDKLDYDLHKKNEVLMDAVQFCKNKANKNSEGQIGLEAISKRLFPSEHEEFRKCAQETHHLSANIGVDNSVLKKFSVYTGKTKDWSLQFSRESLNNSVKFDKKNKSLTICPIPEDLLESLEKDTTDDL